MGLPASWAILSLLHYMVFRSLGLRSFAIRGDDAIARMTESQWRRYQSLVSMIGFPVNKKKTFIDPKRGTFCERFYALDGDELKLQPSLGLRVCNPEGDIPARDQEVNWRDSLLSTTRCHRFARIACSDLFDLCSKFKLPKYAPSFYGGGGLPPPSETARCSPRFEAIARTIDTQGIGLPPIIKQKGRASDRIEKILKTVKWSTSTQLTCPHVERMFNELLAPAGVEDCLNGTYSQKVFSKNRYFSMLKKSLSRVPPSFDAGMRGRRYIDMYQRTPLPTLASVQAAFDHRCRLKDAKLGRSVTRFFPTFFLNF